MKSLVCTVLVASLASAAVLSPVPAAAESGKQVNVAVRAETENFMWTITKSTFYGGIFGGLIGFAGLLASEFEMDPSVMAFTTAGGMVLGSGVGVWEVSTRKDVLVANHMGNAAGPTVLVRVLDLHW